MQQRNRVLNVLPHARRRDFARGSRLSSQWSSRALARWTMDVLEAWVHRSDVEESVLPDCAGCVSDGTFIIANK